MSTRRFFEDKGDLRGKESVRVSKIVSPKGRDLMECVGVNTTKASSKPAPGRSEIFESLRRGRRSSANKSGLVDTTKQSIKFGNSKSKARKSKPKQKTRSLSKQQEATSKTLTS